jgi:hypothetical protein
MAFTNPLRIVKLAGSVVVFDHGIPNAVNRHQQGKTLQARLTHDKILANGDEFTW